MLYRKSTTAMLSLILAVPALCQAQFLDAFDDSDLEDWDSYTGDGEAEVEFVQKEGHARILIDATEDKHNVWWAIIKRDVSGSLDLSQLVDPSYELRVEAKVRVSDAPRRVNMMVNTQRTTDYHVDLREYDIPDTTDWHTISMTTTGLDAVPGDALYVQLAATDWGRGEYHVDVDYYSAEIVNVQTAGPDKGEPLAYHPPVPDTARFSSHSAVAHDASISTEFPDVNFNDWRATGGDGEARTLTVSSSHWPILRWDFGERSGSEADGPGLLELTTHSLASGGNYVDAYGEDLGIEFGKIRVIEILGGAPDWDQSAVTYNSLMQGGEPSDTLNSQTTFDVEPSSAPGGKTYATLPRPVMQRLLDGTTKGLLIRPLGALHASFYSSEDTSDNRAPMLHFNATQ